MMSGANAVASAALLAATLAAAGPAAGSVQGIGVYKGAGCEGRARIADYEKWLGRPVDMVIDFLAVESWAELLSSADWIADCWRGCGFRLALAVPMLPEGGGADLASGARGEYDEVFRHLAKILIRHGHADAILRIGWEFNGAWSAWDASRDPDAFVAFWRRIVGLMRGVPGARFLFDWNPTVGINTIPADQVYPGDDVVDIVGLDVYNQSWSVPATAAARWNEIMHGEFGLAWHAEFAKARGKPRSFPEWGTGMRPDGHGGGDDAMFMERMAQWLRAPGILYQAYWDYSAPDYDALLSAGHRPAAAEIFLREFGVSGRAP